MTYTVCKHKKYIGGDVLESSLKVDSLENVLDLVMQERLHDEVFESVKEVMVGHHFVENDEYVYQIVIK